MSVFRLSFGSVEGIFWAGSPIRLLNTLIPASSSNSRPQTRIEPRFVENSWIGEQRILVTQFP